MTKVKVEQVVVTRLSCEKCGKSWYPRFKHPAVCPRCKARINWRVVELNKLEKVSEGHDLTSSSSLIATPPKDEGEGPS